MTLGPAPGDLSGDGKSDILWRNTTTGLVYLYLMDRSAIGSATAVVTVEPEWRIAELADLDGDGRSDILWHNDVTGLVYAYLMNGSTIASAAAVTTVDPAWTIAR